MECLGLSLSVRVGLAVQDRWPGLRTVLPDAKVMRRHRLFQVSTQTCHGTGIFTDQARWFEGSIDRHMTDMECLHGVLFSL